MSALARDVRGNTLALMAAMLIPISALAGSAIDVARLYVVKVRLQQACDAGALAGRKFMADTNSTTLDSNASTQATNFFKNNFQAGWMTTNTVSFTATKTSDSQVAGTATAVVPMTIMKMFGASANTITVTCEARFDVADTDVIFVLDTTGSMACLPSDSETTCNNYVGAAGNNSYVRPSGGGGVNGYAGTTAYSVPEKANSRIEALRQAVLSFYTAFAANADPSTHVRYGFVTYSSTVNAGQAIISKSPSYMLGGSGTNGSTVWNYESRQVTGDFQISSSSSSNNLSHANCTSTTTRSPATGYDPSNGRATITSQAWSSNSGTCKVTTQIVGPTWTYKQFNQDVSQIVAGNTITDPTKVTGATTSWLGCVEERTTTPGVMTFGTTSLPADLDPDLVPTSDNTRWKPLWQDVVYGRNWSNNSSNGFSSTNTDTTNGDDNNNDPNYGNASLLKSGFVACGKPVQRLKTMSVDDVHDYVYATDFVPIGGTYHDTGMIWGTRLLSPTGIFAGDTAAWPGRSAPNRVIVFLTDGDMAPTPNTYGMYGVEFFDKRVTGGDFSNQKNYHNARFLAECSAAKARNIDVWTVTIAPSATSQMQTCATTTAQALFSTDGTGLSTAFQSIAKHLAMLRITQ